MKIYRYVRTLCILALLLTMAGCTKKSTVATQPEAAAGTNENTTSDPWQQVEGILAQIVPPTFPDKDFDVTTYGAVGDGKTDNSEAIRKAIQACSSAGGGRVVVPAGKYLTGPIYLESNVNLHVEKDARVLFSTNPKDYLPLVYTRWEGVELMNYSPLIYAFEEKNIAVTGEGVLDGQANETNWWPWKGNKRHGWQVGTPNQNDSDKRAALFEMAENNVPVSERKFGEGYYLRPQFVQPYRCENVLIEGVTIVNSPMWILNPVLCNNVTIQGVTVESQGPNSDGCDPESCKNVLIKDCFFNTGDDCIAIKSGRNADGRRINVPSENIIIQGCTMANGHGGVVIGSEISGGVRNVFAENCTMNSPLLDRALRIKTSSMRGGVVENVYLRNIEVGQVAEQVIRVNMFYEDEGPYIPTVRNVEVRNMTVQNGGDVGVLLEGYAESPVQNLRLINVQINNVKEPYKFSNVKNIEFENVTINGKPIILPDSISPAG
ncbi:glycoside hydrolase family 28 protein [Pontibacter akesuensis]|uniref:Polygalacturonase n=1 Tax=Pontibacter akesuensis TaxID=388950 RepID=A0A1I7K539_9BACT|nr:glycoside hydrolase family 28 protein [Pontibacter akesuensis]GHA75000.1 glycoside hydrolase [Pontibacter akesuensis]SFU92556.1 Polygalacturonase [Pontibacter akesuensis]